MSSLLARTVDYEETPTHEDFSRYHLRESDLAGVSLTETAHPRGFRIPWHAHEMASFYFLIAGSLTEQFGNENADGTN